MSEDVKKYFITVEFQNSSMKKTNPVPLLSPPGGRKQRKNWGLMN